MAVDTLPDRKGEERTFKPAFEPDAPYEARHAKEPHTPRHSTDQEARPLGHAALKLDLGQEVRGVALESVGALLEGPRKRMTVVRERKIERYAPLVTAVASALAHKSDPKVEFRPPTADDIKERNGFARFVSNVLHFFSANWGERFDSYLVRTATERIQHIATRAKKLIDSVAEIDRPKASFLDELEAFYSHIKDAATKPKTNKNPIVDTARTVYGRPSGGGRDRSWYSEEQFPLVAKVLKTAAPDPLIAETPLAKAKIRAATPEIMQGVAMFLERNGRQVEPMEQQEKPSLSRRLALKYGRGALESVAQKVSTTLDHAYAAMPENGQEFATDIQALSKKIVELTDQGYSGQEIADKLREDVWPKRPPSEL